jgi:hypothetical protein
MPRKKTKKRGGGRRGTSPSSSSPSSSSSEGEGSESPAKGQKNKKKLGFREREALRRQASDAKRRAKMQASAGFFRSFFDPFSVLFRSFLFFFFCCCCFL